MPGPVRHVFYLIGVRFRAGTQPVEDGADRGHQIDIATLILATHVVTAAQLPSLQDRQQRIGMVFDIEPVAYLQPLSVNGDWPAFQRVQDHHRDQFFRELVGPVIVGTIADHHRQAKGFVPGADQMIAARLGGGIGAAGGISRIFREHAGFTQRAIDLIGGDMVKPEAFRPPLRHPPRARRFKKRCSAQHIGGHKRIRPVNRAVHMAFGGQMHDCVRGKAGNRSIHRRPIPDIRFKEAVKRAVRHAGHVVQTGGIAQYIEVQHLVSRCNRLPHNSRSYKPGPAGDKDAHSYSFHSNGLSNSARLPASESLPDRIASPVRPQSIPISASSNRIAPSHSGA